MNYKIIVLLLVLNGCVAAQEMPGKLPDGRILLHNGWMLKPAGESMECGEFPLNMRISPNGKYIAIMDAGVSSVTVGLFDVKLNKVVSTTPLPNGWFGLCWGNDERLFASGGYEDCVYQLQLVQDSLVLTDSIPIGSAGQRGQIGVAGVDNDKNFLYVTGLRDSILYVVSIEQHAVVKRIPLGGIGYAPLRSKKFPYVFVSEWSGFAVDVVDLDSMKVIKNIPVGFHPSAMAEDARSKRLFVACSGDNAVSIVDIAAFDCKQRFSTTPFTTLVPGSMPNALAVSPDGTRLYVANGGNNAVVVYSITDSPKMGVMGWIPTGWFPDAVIATKEKLYVLNAKGNASLDTAERTACIMYKGTLESIPGPYVGEFKRYTQQLASNTPYYAHHRETVCSNSPIPDSAGLPSPIKYIIYIVKDNASYDQVFGDMVEGNGSEKFCEYPESVTPNQHALAREFVLLDNFYADGDAATDGHSWTLGGWCTDYASKLATSYYGNRGEPWEFTGQSALAMPKVGYLWDYCDWKGKKVRLYGEFTEATHDTLSAPAQGVANNLFGMVVEDYPSFNLSVMDTVRWKKWQYEFDKFEAHHVLPNVIVIHLPNDHTAGVAPGYRTPRAMAADNDLALGKIVASVSHSPFWKQSAIFVVENNTANARDHVDPHRTVALVISPYAKRHTVDHTMYSTTGMLATIERIVGIPPMSEYDQSARVMCNAFTTDPAFMPYDVRMPKVDLDERNPGAEKATGSLSYDKSISTRQ
ncbi:MAG TPA: bifunctional YncE family protein/alkaline phosphatase family protein [Candidatus Kapabacteria bacterium]|nr:bifunctional YncE family protein/alkaline phosphatase family protein [Candidatus Kapabacteria bacterium]